MICPATRSMRAASSGAVRDQRPHVAHAPLQPRRGSLGGGVRLLRPVERARLVAALLGVGREPEHEVVRRMGARELAVREQRVRFGEQIRLRENLRRAADHRLPGVDVGRLAVRALGFLPHGREQRVRQCVPSDVSSLASSIFALTATRRSSVPIAGSAMKRSSAAFQAAVSRDRAADGAGVDVARDAARIIGEEIEVLAGALLVAQHRDQTIRRRLVDRRLRPSRATPRPTPAARGASPCPPDRPDTPWRGARALPAVPSRDASCCSSVIQE